MYSFFASCRAAAINFVEKAFSASFKKDSHLQSLFTLFFYIVYTTARKQVGIGAMKATEQKDSYDQLPKVVLQDVVRVLPDHVKQELLSVVPKLPDITRKFRVVKGTLHLLVWP